MQGEMAKSRAGRMAGFLVAAMALSGGAALIYEVVANEVLFFFFDSSSYSIATVLTSFLGGLAIGSFFIARNLGRVRNKRLAFAAMQVSIGVYALFFLANFELVPHYLSVFYDWAGSNALLLNLSKFAVANAYLVFPTIMMGASFPLAVSLLVKKASEAGKDVGKLYSADLAGAIAGAFLGGFILIPIAGLKAACFAGALMNFSSAGLMIGRKNPWHAAAAAAVSLATVLFFILAAVAPIAAEETHLQEAAQEAGGMQLSAGQQQADGQGEAAKYSGQQQEESPEEVEKYFERKDVLFKADSAYGQVHVIRIGSERILYLNRRFECFSGSASEKTFPNAVLEGLEGANVLVIGLGCGITAGSVAESGNVAKATVLEINPAVVEASALFKAENRNVLENEKVELIVEDAAMYLMNTDEKFGAIFMDVENPQVAHSSALYTVEYFQIMKKRLNEEGTLAIWGSYGNYDYIRTVYKSLRAAFPLVYVKNASAENTKLFYAFKSGTGIPLTEEEKAFNQQLEEDGQFELNTLENQVLKNKFNAEALKIH